MDNTGHPLDDPFEKYNMNNHDDMMTNRETGIREILNENYHSGWLYQFTHP